MSKTKRKTKEWKPKDKTKRSARLHPVKREKFVFNNTNKEL